MIPDDTRFPCSTSQLKLTFAIRKPTSSPSGIERTAVTGLAGPGGGTEETPVGTVFMGCYCAGKTTVREFHFEGDRKSIRDQAVDQALTFICDRLRKYDR